MHMQKPLKGSLVVLDNITEEDLPELWEIIYDTEHPEWRKWDSPYVTLHPMDYEKFHDQMLNLIKHKLDKQFLIKANDEIIGIIFYDWEHESSNSLEVGLTIYRHEYLNRGYELDTLKTWVDYLFDNFPIPRIGLTTWSGNERLLSIGKELGMMVEGRIRKSRLYRGRYYDSVKLGILREEWEEQQHQ
ncbi:Protein N-acetyltransferase, RimJ/RimL family [Mesobacillus persicus]|uniref:Protein N-acetyltransferase, RimJ/RimL family n=1 Tax=Mesobacillus persicus TaxID=930146 RepID=A0A1H8EVF0_9BACI|nr:GNAT family protein [Mesobacillus persicus]SEN22867.1 Protein N-acetyltransferase, RimJ/RimL family [Mesobacillus persicus]